MEISPLTTSITLSTIDPTPETVASFASLFRGRTDAHGTLDIDLEGGETYKTSRKAVTAEHYRQHLTGECTIGIHPLLDDGTVYWAALDFDKGDEADEPRRCKSLLKAYGIEAYLERSKRKGWHVWILFSSPVNAAHVRQALSAILKNADCDPSTERFPKQDKLPAKSPSGEQALGNFLNIPYAGDAAPGRRVVLDDNLEPLTLEGFLQVVQTNNPALLTKITPVLEPRERLKIVYFGDKGPYRGDDPACVRAVLSTPAAEGTRHNVGMRLAQFWLHTRQFDEDETWDRLQEWNEQSDPPMDDTELHNCLQVSYQPSCTWLRQEEVFNKACVWQACNFYRKPEDERQRTDRQTADVPPFPTQLLAPVMREYVEEAATSLNCAVDLVAVPALVFAAGTLHNSVRIAVKRDWATSPTLYAACVGAIGDGKSPALDKARRPFDVFERETERTYRVAYAAYQSELTDWKAAKKAEKRGPEPAKPVREQHFVTDCTMETLAGYLSSQDHSVVYVADELVSWIKACDMYRGGKGTDRQNWLSIWANQPIKTGRRTREGEYVEHATVCVVGGVQPGIVKSVGEGEDGLCERILWSFPKPGKGGWSEESVSEETEHNYLELFRRLRDKRMDSPLQLSRDAYARWTEWFNQNNAAMNLSTGRERGIRSKLDRHAQRLALVLHCIQHPGDTQPNEVIELETLEGAFTLTAYFLVHAMSVMKLLKVERRETDKIAFIATRILTGLRERGDWVSKEGIFEITGRNASAGDLEAVLSLLEENGNVESQPGPRGIGRPSKLWRAVAETGEEDAA
jgi:Protein of unknown function (DUF3987)/Primase C terminal 1 (PriCT-1)